MHLFMLSIVFLKTRLVESNSTNRSYGLFGAAVSSFVGADSKTSLDDLAGSITTLTIRCTQVRIGLVTNQHTILVTRGLIFQRTLGPGSDTCENEKTRQFETMVCVSPSTRQLTFVSITKSEIDGRYLPSGISVGHPPVASHIGEQIFTRRTSTSSIS